MEDTALPQITSKRFKYLVNEAKVIYKTTKNYGVHVSTSKDAYDYLINHVFDPDTIECYEEFYVLFFNRAHNLKNVMHIATGNATRTVIDIKRILKVAIDCLAESVLLAHNHPSGNIKMSDEDILMSGQVEQALNSIDVKLLDSLAISKSSYTSIRDEGLI
jgi:DNA repair protein RadC